MKAVRNVVCQVPRNRHRASPGEVSNRFLWAHLRLLERCSLTRLSDGPKNRLLIDTYRAKPKLPQREPAEYSF